MGRKKGGNEYDKVSKTTMRGTTDRIGYFHDHVCNIPNDLGWCCADPTFHGQLLLDSRPSSCYGLPKWIW